MTFLARRRARLNPAGTAASPPAATRYPACLWRVVGLSPRPGNRSPGTLLDSPTTRQTLRYRVAAPQPSHGRFETGAERPPQPPVVELGCRTQPSEFAARVSTDALTSQVRLQPVREVPEHQVLLGLVEDLVVEPVVHLQRLVLGAGQPVDQLGALGVDQLVVRAAHDQERQLE